MEYDYGEISAILLTVMAFLIPILIVEVIANWRIFKKAGEEGWKSLIPFYNQVVMCKCFMGKSEIAAIPIAAQVLLRICMRSDGLIGFGLLVYLGYLVFSIFQSIYLAKSFGKDSGFAVGLIFLPSIFKLILAFGNSEYYGPKGISEYPEYNYYGYGNLPYSDADRYQYNNYQNNGYNNGYQNNGYQNNNYNNNYQNNSYQNKGYNNNYQNNGYQNNDFNSNYQNNGYQNNDYNSNYQNNGYQNNGYNSNYQNNSYQNNNYNNNTNNSTYQNPVNNYNGGSYQQNPSNNDGFMDGIDTSKIDINNTEL